MTDEQMRTGHPMSDASPEHPIYAKVQHDEDATSLFFITCDEGWRLSSVCEYMYGWAADWLIEIIQGKPYAGGRMREHALSPKGDQPGE